jgi:hypothetical protein
VPAEEGKNVCEPTRVQARDRFGRERTGTLADLGELSKDELIDAMVEGWVEIIREYNELDLPGSEECSP